MTFNSEYQKADATLKEQQPGFSDEERFLKADERATIRTGSQVGATTGIGTLIDSVLPVGGIAVGFTVGLGVGVLMMVPTGDGKSVGDRFTDLGKWGWNGIKGTEENFLNTIKGLFG